MRLSARSKHFFQNIVVLFIQYICQFYSIFLMKIQYIPFFSRFARLTYLHYINAHTLNLKYSWKFYHKSLFKQGFKQNQKIVEFFTTGLTPPLLVGKKNKKLKYSASLNSARTLKNKLLSAIFKRYDHRNKIKLNKIKIKSDYQPENLT